MYRKKYVNYKNLQEIVNTFVITNKFVIIKLMYLLIETLVINVFSPTYCCS